MYTLLSKLFIKDYQNTNCSIVKQRYINFHTLISIIVSVLFIAIKLYYGLLYNSISLIGDAIESVTNIASALLIFISYKVSALKESVDYPFGRGRILYIANFIIAFFLIFTGYEISKMAIDNLIHTRSWPQFDNTFFYVIGFSVLLNEWITFYAIYIGKKIDSSIMISEAKHRRVDTYTTLGILISWLGVSLGFPWVDSVGGAVFAFFIFKAAYSIAKESISDLLGTKPSTKEVDKITQIAKSVDGVWDIHEVIIHNYGHKKVVSFHVEMDQNLSLKKAHDICDQVESITTEKTGFYCTTHSDPIDLSNPFTKTLALFIKDTIHTHPALIQKVSNIRDIRIDNKVICCDIFIKRVLTPEAEKNVTDILTQEIQKEFNDTYILKASFRPIMSTNF